MAAFVRYRTCIFFIHGSIQENCRLVVSPTREAVKLPSNRSLPSDPVGDPVADLILIAARGVLAYLGKTKHYKLTSGCNVKTQKTAEF